MGMYREQEPEPEAGLLGAGAGGGLLPAAGRGVCHKRLGSNQLLRAVVLFVLKRPQKARLQFNQWQIRIRSARPASTQIQLRHPSTKYPRHPINPIQNKSLFKKTACSKCWARLRLCYDSTGSTRNPISVCCWMRARGRAGAGVREELPGSSPSTVA